MPTSWGARPRRRVLTTLTAVLAVIGLAGCGGTGAATQETPAQGTRLASAQVLEDPRSHLGPSTAVLHDAALQPVAVDPVPGLPVTVTDSQGTEVTVTDVSRILPIDIYGTTSRVVYQLGLGENIVGRDVSSTYAEVQDRPLVTVNGHQLNGEAILDLAPTLIITDTSLGPWDVVLQMREAGIPVVVVDSHRSLETVDDLIMQVAAAVGLAKEGHTLAERSSAEIEEMSARIRAIAPPEGAGLRTVFLYVRGQSDVYYMFGSGSGTDSLITALGGVDVASEIGWTGMRPLTDEGLIKAQPELVLMMTKGLESVGGVDGLVEQIPALALTPAGERRRIVDMPDTEILGFGPNSADVLEALAVAIYAPETLPR